MASSKRKSLGLNMTLQNILVTMCEGNPGGLRVLMQIVEKDPSEGLFRILDLDDMNIRGGQIWIGYKDHCGADLDKFIQLVSDRDKDLVKTINERSSTDWLFGRQVAVTGGASYAR